MYPKLRGTGVAVDGISWLLPHYVVWRLKLRKSHKIAITVIFAFGLFNIIIGGLRVNSLADVTYQDDVTFGIGTTLIWAITQISTGIIVACCPHLRPLFERILPRRLTHISSWRSRSRTTYSRTPQSSQAPQPEPGRQGSITVTTDIAVENSSCTLPLPVASFHDGQHEPWAPTFDVEKGPATRLKYLAYCCGGSRRHCGCC
ncbi:hypothetical protein EJ02DRAFT_446549 [Clathrospora elynae]|uniref:Rhodopsin domain-containing protein n=1 Tax=Clathrospora elynae TaxID=706981 RepID=A0A6A5SK40_9PLEO|nr:hypothetical protein EJ02DRAFT_446549 [Clathrospora elynae]